MTFACDVGIYHIENTRGGWKICPRMAGEHMCMP